MTVLELDYESFGVEDLRDRGLDVYSADPNTEILMAAYRLSPNGKSKEAPIHWQAHEEPPPLELLEALNDPSVPVWAFNAQFERVMTDRVFRRQLKKWRPGYDLAPRYENWRCTLALANMRSFTGTLEMIGEQCELPEIAKKDKDGKRLIDLFCKPQRVTKTQPYERRDHTTDPEDWAKFCRYNVQDVVAEGALRRRLLPFPLPDIEWEIYELDQLINDRGKPCDLAFVNNVLWMAQKRKNELIAQMKDVTSLANPNSVQQFIPWLKERGYPFDDLRKDTVKKVLRQHVDGAHVIDDDAVDALKLRQWAARTSTRKYNAIVKSVGEGDRLRYLFQFAGAARTNRWAGRKVQTQNLPSTPECLEPFEDKETGEYNDDKLTVATNCIRNGDYDSIALMFDEPMEAFVGLVRSAFSTVGGPDDDKEFVAADLASIESAVIATLSMCMRLLMVFRNHLDPYKDFATVLFKIAYEEVTKAQRKFCKPPTLGCGFRLGGGETREGKKTGLMGYAEGMGVELAREESHRIVHVWRDTYTEIPDMWINYEIAVANALRFPGEEFRVNQVTFVKIAPFLCMRLPSDRHIFYFQPLMETKRFYTGQYRKIYAGGRVIGEEERYYDRQVFTYMGKQQGTNRWTRLENHGGRFTEQSVQGTARDVLAHKMLRAHRVGYHLVAHVHDELVGLQRKGDNQHTLAGLIDILKEPLDWLPELPLGAAGWTGAFYRK